MAQLSDRFWQDWVASIMAADRPSSVLLPPAALAGIGMPCHAHPRQPCSHTHSLTHTLIHIHISHTGPNASLCHAPTTWVTSSRPGQEAVRASTYTTHAWPEMHPLPSRDNQRSIPVPGWRRPSNICKKQEIDEDWQKTTKGSQHARVNRACMRLSIVGRSTYRGTKKTGLQENTEPQDSISQAINTRHRHKASIGLCLAFDSALFRSDLSCRCCGLVQLPRLVSFNSPFLRDWIKDSTTKPHLVTSVVSFVAQPDIRDGGRFHV